MDEREQEERFKMELAQNQRAAMRSAKGQSKIEEKKKLNDVEKMLVVGLSFIFDGLGLIPIIGALTGLIGGALMWLWVHLRGLNRGRLKYLSWTPGGVALIRFVPIIGNLPLYFTSNALLTISLNSKAGQKLTGVRAI
ncbi:hypothetical protein HYW53_01225 [Candidatus Giovannonibacteria bacterium]|nr:hypothetical protein [Candidatus Giovannonibacteria bacterium]